MIHRLLTACCALLPVVVAAQEKQDLHDQVSEENLKATVDKLVSFGTRNSLSTKGVVEARDWLKGEFEKIAKGAKAEMKVEFHEFTDKRLKRGDEMVPQKNVAAFLKGKKHPRQAVVFGAHYDSLNLKERDPDVVAPGANDNATGTASVLETARILSQVAPERTLIFVAFTAEEQGLIGAWHFAKHLKDSGYDVVAMINNDIVGGAKDDNLRPLNLNDIRCFSAGPHDSPSRRLARVAKLVVERRMRDLTVLLQDATDRKGRGGDHQSFNKHDIAAMRLIETNETDRLHHTARDTAERIHYPYHALATKADVALLASLGSAPEAPGAPEVSGDTVTWKKVDGAARYLVGVRQGGLEFADVVETAQASYRFNGAVPEGGVQVSVAAMDAQGNVSLFSAEATIGGKK